MQKTPNFLTKNTISKILDENKQNKTKTLLSIQTTDENL